MRNRVGFPAPPKISMRPSMIAILIAVFLLLSACAQTRNKMLLTDTQMDQIGAGSDLCALFGVAAPCAGSLLQVYDPALGVPETPFTSKVGVPLPPSGKITIQQSFAIEGSATSQSASQSNSLSVQPSFRSLCFTCWQPMDVTRLPGH